MSPLIILVFVVVAGICAAVFPMDERFKKLTYYICIALTVIAIFILVWPYLTSLSVK